MRSFSSESSENSDSGAKSSHSSSSSASSREDLDEGLGNVERMGKRMKFKEKPLYIDDSHIGQGKYMHVVQLQSYRMSILPFVSVDQKMNELNRQFRNDFPRIRKAITFSKIRTLKQRMVRIFLGPEAVTRTALLESLAMKKQKGIGLTGFCRARKPEVVNNRGEDNWDEEGR